VSKLSLTMHRCLSFARANGGTIHRHAGARWAQELKQGWNPLHEQFGTSTVEALVQRGELEYCEWKDGRRGRFPIAARLIGGKS